MTSTDVSKTFTEEDTVEAEKATDLFAKSRILAEKTAFEFIKELPGEWSTRKSTREIHPKNNWALFYEFFFIFLLCFVFSLFSRDSRCNSSSLKIFYQCKFDRSSAPSESHFSAEGQMCLPTDVCLLSRSNQIPFFAEEERFELVVINPALVLGPVICSATSSCSIEVYIYIYRPKYLKKNRNKQKRKSATDNLTYIQDVTKIPVFIVWMWMCDKCSWIHFPKFMSLVCRLRSTFGTVALT